MDLGYKKNSKGRLIDLSSLPDAVQWLYDELSKGKLLRYEVAEYDFSVNEKVNGSVIPLEIKLPINSVIYRAITEVEVTTAGGDLTVRSGNTSLVTVEAGSTGITEPELLSGTDDAIKIVESKKLNIVIETADMTAGKVKIALFFYISE